MEAKQAEAARPEDRPFPTATVLVTMEGGLIQNIDANLPGLRVIVADFDVEGVDEHRLVPNWDGDKATWVAWRPKADPELIETVEEYVAQGERQEAEEEAREKAAEAEKARQLAEAHEKMGERKALEIMLGLAEYGASMVPMADADIESEEPYGTGAEEADAEHARDVARLFGEVRRDSEAAAVVRWIKERIEALDKAGA